MRQFHLWLAAGAATAGVLIACSDLGAPSRPVPYESRLFVPFDDNGQPAVDSIRFHWPRSSRPVTYWVEDSLGVPVQVQDAIDRWKGAFLYREWDGTMISDSNAADVIVRVLVPPPKPGLVWFRRESLRPECEGATDIDTVTTRQEFRVPVRIYLNPKFASDSLSLCLGITATHELGHSIGLFQHTGDALDIMFANPVVTQLSARDIATIEALYHRETDMVPVRP